MKSFLRLFLRLVFVMLFLAMPGTASAQMVETFKDDQSSQTASSVMEVYFCESEDGFSFSLYDMRVNPEKRVLH